MNHIKRTKTALAVAMAVTALTLGGCVVSARPAYDGPVVAVAPPPPQPEVIGVAPAPGYVWFGGYWGAGRAGYHWVPHHWVQGPRGGWHMVQGHWAR